MLAKRSAGKQLPKGLDAAWDIATGYAGRLKPRAKRFLHRAAGIVAMEAEFRDLSDSRLREQAREYRDLFRRGRDRPPDLDRAAVALDDLAALDPAPAG